MPKIFSRVKEMGRGIRKSAKESGVGFKGRQLKLGGGFGINIEKTNPSSMLPFRSRLYNYKRLDNLGKGKVIKKPRQESYVEKRVEYEKGGKKIVEIYRREPQKVPKKRRLKVDNTKVQSGFGFQPSYGFGTQDLKKIIPKRKSFWRL